MEKEERCSLGLFVKQRLQELGLSQIEAARKMGLNASVISRIVTHRIQNPNEKLTGKLAEILEVAPEQLKVLFVLQRPPRPAERENPQQNFVPRNVWALCIVLEKMLEKPIEDILYEKIEELVLTRKEKEKQ